MIVFVFWFRSAFRSVTIKKVSLLLLLLSLQLNLNISAVLVKNADVIHQSDEDNVEYITKVEVILFLFLIQTENQSA